MGRKKVEPPTKKTLRRGCRKRKPNHSWVQLPYPAMVKVMEKLTDSERVNTAQVCQRWRDAFQNPGLWRTRHFEFGGSKANASGRNALTYVRSKGHFLQRVSITCRHITSNTCENITGTLEPFVECLLEAVLREFRISGLELDRFWKYSHLRGKTADCLGDLLSRQQDLQVLEMSLAQFGLLPGVELLEKVSNACGSKLTTLLLEDFFHSRLAVFELSRFRDVLQSFGNLREVALNYCCLYDDLLECWAESLRGKLSSVHIKASDNEPHAHVISDSSWKALVAACPNLSVDMSIVGISPSSSVVPMLAPHAPLTSLHMWSGYDNDIPLQLSDTLYHIANSHATKLLRLHIDFDNYQDDIDDALIQVVAYCRNLKHLYIKANSSVMVANVVCQLVRERQTLLTSVYIMLCDMSDLEMEHLRDLREEMEPLAQQQGISLVLQNDLF